MRIRVGDFVWFWANTPPTDDNPDVQPETAQVVFVHNSKLVNLVVTGHTGARRILTSTRFFDGVGDRPTSNFAEFVPPVPDV